MLEGIQHQIDRIGQRHHEAGHARVGDRDGLARPNLLHKQGNDRAARSHHIAIARAANHRAGAFQVAAGGHHYLFHHRFGDAHGVDGIHRLVGAKANHPLHSGIDGSLKDVFGTQHVGTHRLHRMELARRHLLERGRVKNEIHPTHGLFHAALVTHIANVELELGAVVALAHIVLFLLIAGEDSNLGDVRIKEALEDGIAEGAGSTGNQQHFIGEHVNSNI